MACRFRSASSTMTSAASAKGTTSVIRWRRITGPRARSSSTVSTARRARSHGGLEAARDPGDLGAADRQARCGGTPRRDARPPRPLVEGQIDHRALRAQRCAAPGAATRRLAPALEDHVRAPVRRGRAASGPCSTATVRRDLVDRLEAEPLGGRQSAAACGRLTATAAAPWWRANSAVISPTTPAPVTST